MTHSFRGQILFLFLIWKFVCISNSRSFWAISFNIEIVRIQFLYLGVKMLVHGIIGMTDNKGDSVSPWNIPLWIITSNIHLCTSFQFSMIPLSLIEFEHYGLFSGLPDTLISKCRTPYTYPTMPSTNFVTPSRIILQGSVSFVGEGNM